MKRNLLIIAHGSRSEQWNAAIGDFVQELRSRLSGMLILIRLSIAIWNLPSRPFQKACSGLLQPGIMPV